MSTVSTSPKVALIGRPNVGKSTLFNRLIRSKRAITHDRPGVTRDRMEGVVRSKGQEEFLLVDTGGLTLDSHQKVEEGPAGIRGFEKAILEQTRAAVGESDLLCLVVDARDGLTPMDDHLATFLRKQGKPVILVVNKVDGPERQDILLAEFHVLGLEMFPCSAEHGFNVRNLEDEIRFRLFDIPDEAELEIPEDSVLLDGASRRQKKRLLQELRQQAGESAALDDYDNSEPEAPGEEPADADAETNIGESADAKAENDADGSGRNADASAASATSSASAVSGEVTRESQREKSPFIGVDGELYTGEAEETDDVPASDEPLPVYAGPEVYSGALRLAMLGRPNAGKSSLVNALVGESRMIVSDVAGTTRDSVDVSAELDGEPCVFVDTAGVRRRSKITDTVERFSVNSSLKSTTKAHVTLLVLDVNEGLTQQDKRLIDLLHERKTPFMLLINKSDLIEHKKRKETEKLYKEALVFCPHVPLLFVSAKNKYNLYKIVPLAKEIRRECGLRVPTGLLNRTMTSVLERHQAPMVRRLRPKFFYLTQAESLPPTFVFFVNDADRVNPSYARYLERSMRKMFGIKHAPMRVNFRSAHSKRNKKK